MNFGLNFRDFFDRYFEDHDEAFLASLGEAISEKDDPREIAALADWSFRNYVIDALVLALEANNERIYNDMIGLVDERMKELTAIIEPLRREIPRHEAQGREMPADREPTHAFPGSTSAPAESLPILRESPPPARQAITEHPADRRPPAPPEVRRGFGGLTLPASDSFLQKSAPRTDEGPVIKGIKPLISTQPGDAMKGMPAMRELRDLKKMSIHDEEGPSSE